MWTDTSISLEATERVEREHLMSVGFYFPPDVLKRTSPARAMEYPTEI